jgi:hemolysin activation/secretion protein
MSASNSATTSDLISCHVAPLLRQPRLRRPIACFSIIGTLLGAGQALAIDAGSQLRRFQDETQRRMQDSPQKRTTIPDLAPAPSQAAAAASAAQSYVSGFEVAGVTQFSDNEIAFVLKDFMGRKLSTADIHAAANQLTRHYRKAGYMLAKVFVPPQAFDEVIRLDVEEGHLEKGGVELVNKGKRVNSDAVRQIFESHLYSDHPLKRNDLERAILLADDLPGTRLGSILYPGTEVGSARLRSVMSDEPLITGNIDIDNFNNRTLGQERLGTTLYLNSPSGAGDQLVTRFVTSGERSNYAYLTYLRPVGGSGMRLGASVDYFNYDASALYDQGEVSGHASDVRLYLTYPLIRSRYTNINLRTDLSHYRITDRNTDNPNFALTANPFAQVERRINRLKISFSGDETHDALPNGTTLFDVDFVAGQVDVSGNENYQNFDSNGPRTDGGFARFHLRLQRLQHLWGAWSAYASLNGQLASRNLDSSQRLYLGGGTSLSGYPVAEASGDQGGEMHLELRRDIAVPWGGNLQAGLFYSQGWLKQFKNPWLPVDNHISLQTTGFQLTQTIANQWVIRGLVGWQTGGESPVEKLTGNNMDGRNQGYRAWFQVIRYFDFGGN